LTYALARGLTYKDMPAVRAIVHEASRGNYRFSSLVLGITGSAPFQLRQKVPGENTSLSHHLNAALNEGLYVHH